MDLIQHVYLINLARSKDRLQKFQKGEQHKIGLPITRIEAVDGSKLTPEEITKVTTVWCDAFCTPGMIGCFLSHQKAWKLVVENNDAAALILEDDVSVTDDFQEQLGLSLGELNNLDPDWDILFAGCFGNCNPEGLPFFRNLGNMYLPHLPKKPEGDYIFTPVSPLGLQSYIVSNKGARKLLKNLEKVNYHVDVAMLYKAVQPDTAMNVYATKKRIGNQFTSADQSIIASAKFPQTLNSTLSQYTDVYGVSYDYYFIAPIIRVPFFNVIVNLHTILLILLGLICVFAGYPGSFITVFTIFCLIEMNLNTADAWMILRIYSFILVVVLLVPFLVALAALNFV